MKTRRRTEVTVERQISIRITREAVLSCPHCGRAIVPAAAPKPEENK